MKTTKLLILIAATALLQPAMSRAESLPRATPESQGIRSESVAAFLDSMTAFPGTEIHSIVIARHGRIVASAWPSPFAEEYAHTLYSCSKTFVSAAVGMAIAENRLRLDDRVATFFTEDLPHEVSANLAAMTVRDLLIMASGIEPDWSLRDKCDDWTRQLLSRHVDKPGKKFKYDSLCTYLLSAIVQKVSGQPLVDYLRPRLFEPLGIDEVQWEMSPEGHTTGGWGLRLKSESMAKFGILLLQKGVWNGRQLIPEGWIAEMMKAQIDNEGDGYGYQMWPCERPGTARADGAFGQFIYVIPDKDMTVAVTQCGSFDSSRQRGLLWRVLLPGVGDKPEKPGRAYRKLAKKERSYVLRTAEGTAHDSAERLLAGRDIALGRNKYGWKSLRIDRDGQQIRLSVTAEGEEPSVIRCGHGQWVGSTNAAHPAYSITARGRFAGVEGPFGVAGSYGWKDGTLHVRAQYTDWITALDITLKPENGKLTMSIRENNSGKPFAVEARMAGGSSL